MLSVACVIRVRDIEERLLEQPLVGLRHGNAEVHWSVSLWSSHGVPSLRRVGEALEDRGASSGSAEDGCCGDECAHRVDVGGIERPRRKHVREEEEQRVGKRGKEGWTEGLKRSYLNISHTIPSPFHRSGSDPNLSYSPAPSNRCSFRAGSPPPALSPHIGRTELRRARQLRSARHPTVDGMLQLGVRGD